MNNGLPVGILLFFKLREGNYNLRRFSIFETGIGRTNVHFRCVSVLGVKLWNELNDELKVCTSLLSFKNLKIVKGYEVIRLNVKLLGLYSNF